MATRAQGIVFWPTGLKIEEYLARIYGSKCTFDASHIDSAKSKAHAIIRSGAHLRIVQQHDRNGDGPAGKYGMLGQFWIGRFQRLSQEYAVCGAFSRGTGS
jgi:hypothetical protein